MNFMLLLLLIVPVVLIVMWWKKRKSSSMESTTYKKRREGDEVWKTVKDYIRKEDGKGKEIIDSFVAKVPAWDYIDKSWSKEKQIEKKNEIKRIREEENLKRKECKKNNKKYIPLGSRSLYVVLFTSRDAKSLKEDKPRAIECEVIEKKVDKKTTSREIIVTRELNYKEQSEWITPIKIKEEEKFQKEHDRLMKKKAKKEARENKKNEKLKTKNANKITNEKVIGK